MKKYIKPAIEWTEIEGVLPLATSNPGLSGEPAGGGAEACSLGEEDYPIAFELGEGSDSEGGYWGM